MRTTLDIPDAVYRRLKARAATEGRSVSALILRGVQQIVQAKPPGPGGRVSLPKVGSKRSGTLHIDNARIYEIISFP